MNALHHRPAGSVPQARRSRAADSRRQAVLALLLLCAGCASRPPRQVQWAGRLSLQVRSEPAQSFSAAFELEGHARQGRLQLNSPLGTALAQARWGPDQAILQSGGDTRSYPNVEDLMLSATGAALPLAALFDWLEGRPTPVAGWIADLSGLPQGRLLARRSDPLPAVDLRIVLDR